MLAECLALSVWSEICDSAGPFEIHERLSNHTKMNIEIEVEVGHKPLNGCPRRELAKKTIDGKMNEAMHLHEPRPPAVPPG